MRIIFKSQYASIVLYRRLPCISLHGIFLYKKLSLNDVIPVSVNSSNQQRLAAEAIVSCVGQKYSVPFYKAVYHPNHPNGKRSTDIDFCEVDQLFAYNLTGYITYKNNLYYYFYNLP